MKKVIVFTAALALIVFNSTGMAEESPGSYSDEMSLALAYVDSPAFGYMPVKNRAVILKGSSEVRLQDSLRAEKEKMPEYENKQKPGNELLATLLPGALFLCIVFLPLL